MIKRLCATILLIGVLSAPITAQSAYIEFSYQSFRPFIHFQLELSNSSGFYRDPYDTAYLKGYMDGVNDAYYNDYRFYDMVWNIDLYEAGYRDGYRDRDLMIWLRGYDWYYRHRFAYDDYHSPYYSVQIWLGGLSLAFLQVPEQRLPRHWERHSHPLFIKYRHWHKHRHQYNDRDYRYFVRIERDYEIRLNRFRQEAYKERNNYQKQRGRNGYRTGRIEKVSRIDRKQAKQRVKQQPQVNYTPSRTVQNSRRSRTIENSNVRETPTRQVNIRSRSRSTMDKDQGVRNNRNSNVKRTESRRSESIRPNSRDRENSKQTVRKENNREKSRSTVKRERADKKSKSRSSSRGNNRRNN